MSLPIVLLQMTIMFDLFPELLDADSSYIVAIVLLLPLSAGLLVSQTNPLHALVIRGILGAIAALVYAVLGAADVALTEALVGTMLSTTLYAVAVRSSMQTARSLSEADTNGSMTDVLELDVSESDGVATNSLANSGGEQLDDRGFRQT